MTKPWFQRNVWEVYHVLLIAQISPNQISICLGPLRDTWVEKKFDDDDELISEVENFLKCLDVNFFREVYLPSCHDGGNVSIGKATSLRCK